MKRHRKFAIKIVLFNWLGFTLLLSGVTYVDARLYTRFSYGARTYRWGYLVSILGGLFVLFATSISFAKVSSWRLKTALSVGILWIAAAFSLLLFRPEFPHAGITSWIFYLSLASLFSCGIHYSTFRKDRLLAKDLSESIKIERVKQYADLWRTIAISITVGYLALLIPWINFLWNLPSAFVTDPSEQLLLRQFGCAVLAGISMYVLFGIVYEAFFKANEAADLLLEVTSTESKLSD